MDQKSSKERRAMAMALLEESVHLIRHVPGRTLACYWVGSLPFVSGFLYFWEDMSRSAFAMDHLLLGSLGLALLFLWMQVWQAVFAGRLLAWRRGEGDAAVRPRRLAWLVLSQCAVQPWSLVLLPLAMVVGVPFGHAYAFFQNVQVLAADSGPGLSGLIGRSAHQANRWPFQNHLAIWLLSPWPVLSGAALGLVIVPVLGAAGLSRSTESLLYLVLVALLVVLSPLGAAVAVNAGLVLLLGPELLRMLVGLETVSSLRGPHLVSPLFFAVTASVAYLCLDPLMKSVYVLRCFYGEAIATGLDLRADLRRFRSRAVTVLLVLAPVLAAAPDSMAAPRTEAVAGPGAASATVSSSPVSPGRLDEAITRELSRPAYSWRLPRESRNPESQRGLLAGLAGSLVKLLDGWARDMIDLIGQILDWLRWFWRQLVPETPPGEQPAGRPAAERIVLWVLLAAVAALAAVLGTRLWRLSRSRRASRPVAPPGAAALPDLRDESVTPAELPQDGWNSLSRELLARGELRLALRAIYFSILASLAERQLLTLSRCKTDGEYRRELSRRARHDPHLLTSFTAGAALYEWGWYSRHPVDLPAVSRMNDLRRSIQAEFDRLRVK